MAAVLEIAVLCLRIRNNVSYLAQNRLLKDPFQSENKRFVYRCRRFTRLPSNESGGLRLADVQGASDGRSGNF